MSNTGEAAEQTSFHFAVSRSGLSAVRRQRHRASPASPGSETDISYQQVKRRCSGGFPRPSLRTLPGCEPDEQTSIPQFPSTRARLRSTAVCGTLLAAAAAPALAQSSAAGFPRRRRIRNGPTSPIAALRCAGRAPMSGRSRRNRARRPPPTKLAARGAHHAGHSADFPLIGSNVWVWDTWPLSDVKADNLSYKGWGGHFLADRRSACGLFVRRSPRARSHRLLLSPGGIPASQRPASGGWTPRRTSVPGRHEREGLRHRADDAKR